MSGDDLGLSETERLVRDVIEEGLDARFAKLDARMAERLTGLAEKFGTLGSSIDAMARAQIEATRMSEDGPALRHRMNLASVCYGIRLRARCENNHLLAEHHEHIAALAVADADALIKALGERP